MNSLQGLLYGLSVAATPANLLAAFAGAFAGTAIGVLPGLGPVAGVALILPLTFSLDPTAGLIMMAGIFYGSMYGGSTTAILLNIPGESASVVTAIDGYQLARKGRAGATLTIVAVGSFVGGTLAVIGVMMFSSLLANVAILFGPAEFFALTAGGLVVMSRISGGTLASALLPMTLGLMLGTVGQEAVTGETRFTLGLPELAEGVSLVPVVVGLYGFAELMLLIEDRVHAAARPESVRMRQLLPTRTEWKRAVPSWLRGTFLGFLFGLVPGPAATLASFASYRLEKATSKYAAEIGSGAIEGVAGPEAANNSAATASLVPLLALGIPFTPIAALMISAMLVQGIQPGPLLITQHPEIFWGLIASAYIGNVMLLLLNIPMVGVWVSLLRIPHYLFIPLLLDRGHGLARGRSDPRRRFCRAPPRGVRGRDGAGKQSLKSRPEISQRKRCALSPIPGEVKESTQPMAALPRVRRAARPARRACLPKGRRRRPRSPCRVRGRR